jgi:hypothetical protein
VSYLHVQQLRPIRDEFDAARAAVVYLEGAWHKLRDTPEVSGIGISQVREAVHNIEITYIIRLFSKFEGLLYEHLAVSHPGRRPPATAKSLIDRVASRERVPDPIRDEAQKVRGYRNSIVHQAARLGTAPVSVQSFRQAMSALNHFLAYFP